MKFKIFILALGLMLVGCSGNQEEKLQETQAEIKSYAYSEKTTEDASESKNEIHMIESTAKNTSDSLESKEDDSINNEAEKSGTKLIDLKPLCQYPELSTGCEITSLTMVLNYYNINADKCSLADNYLEKGPVGETDFRIAFEGNPRDPNSYGCYAPVIKNTANKYLSEKNSKMTAKDITGTEFEDLFNYVDNGIPVIVWGTLDCRQGHYSVTWHVNGEDLTWFTPEHCMVLVGYDSLNSLVWVGDPVHGDIRSYDKKLFKDRYNSLKKQAVVIE